MLQAAGLIRNTHLAWPRLLVVTSAMSGVTNLLLDSASQAAQGNPKKYIEAAIQLQKMHHAVIQDLISEPKLQARVFLETDQLLSEFSNL